MSTDFEKCLNNLKKNSLKCSNSADIILICGAPRTGTTLVQNILCSSPKVNPLINEVEPLKNISQSFQSMLDLWEKGKSSDYFSDRSEILNLAYQSIDHFIKLVKKRSQVERVVLKLPSLSPYIPFLSEVLKERLHVIVLFRNPIDVIASMKVWGAKSKERSINHPFFDASIYDLSLYLMQFYGFSMKLNMSSGSSFFTVKYEDLVTNPNSIISDLSSSSALDLSTYNPLDKWQVQNYFNSTYDFKDSITSLYGRPITPESIGNGTRFFSYDQCKEILSYTYKFSKSFGYVDKLFNCSCKPLTEKDISGSFEPIINLKKRISLKHKNKLLNMLSDKQAIINKQKEDQKRLRNVLSDKQAIINKQKEDQKRLRIVLSDKQKDY